MKSTIMTMPKTMEELHALLSQHGAHHANSAAFIHRYSIQCHRVDGSLKWQGEASNLVVQTGLDEMLDKFWKGSGYTASFFVGLTDSSPTIAAGDTMAAHAGWTEITQYDEAARQALTLGTVSGQSVNNSASPAVYTMNAATTIGGGFISDNSVKGGTAGILIGAAPFTGADKIAAIGETLTLTATLTAASP